MIVIAAEPGDEEWVLRHGEHPDRLLLRHGLIGTPLSARARMNDLVLTYAVRAASEVDRAAAAEQPDPERPLRVDDGLSDAEIEAAVPRQRPAAYAVVVTDRGLLMTELSARTNAGGYWNLPGGGLEAGEDPAGTVVREVWEETGQQVDDVRLVLVTTARWIGRRLTDGQVQDFHALRIFHTARCPHPTDPVVHDVGGSTASARWMPLASVGELPLAASVVEGLIAAGVDLPFLR